ncbi:MAG: hypothetical protein UT24_C0002G0033 [Candidatus Woesebacteria bacterium GW2011_GWB1_39_12]|uniref:peptidoglycan glycosyltransferase n=2 Tax=Candidatus Woeseibacteriota TaxID=1752722 RepID=A0A0G0PGP8_9BACT|nr:MAG: hypothetical protein UT23_C0014G0020 [Candidatus Woesebacteria bacterium GW2011_GWA1_39_12]KKR01770.1 MAG: hypothetical protein UT24_C0002G0033 [Candidatus Woesebacteria bacterium GW2011_GWB1_39_12]
MSRILFENRKKVFVLSLLALAISLFFWTDPSPKVKGTIKVYDRNEVLIYESSTGVGHQEFVSIDEVPQELKDAVVLTEDERFWYHAGIDPKAITRAIFQNIQEGKIVSGASTIPQQVTRFSVISPQKPAKISLARKLRESLMAIRLSYTTSKEKILERYLNTMHFGRDIYGVGAASRVYFGKDVESLSLAQSALLAGMIANPSRYDPIGNSESASERRNKILGEMYDEKLIDSERYQRAKEESLPSSTSELRVTAPHAVEMVLDELKRMDIKSGSGISVYTTIDSGWYELVRNIARGQIERLKFEHDLTNAAVVIIENKTGNILVLLGSIDYFDEEIQGQNNMAQALRQPGSAMKPVNYAAAFEKGIATPATPIEDLPKVYLTKRGEGFLPHNYDGRYRGIVLVREALASSYNLPAVEMLSQVGIESFLELAHKMGITSMQRVSEYDLALTLGGGEVSLLELTNLYATFARKGFFIPTRLITKIVTDGGKVLYEPELSVPESVLDEKAAFLITDILKDKKARIPTFGEKNQLVLSFDAAVKTGTTTDWHDNWTVGYTPDYTVGVWVGNADNYPMREISGVTGAAPIWNQIFEEIIKFEGSSDFVRPEGIVEVEICSWDGLLPTDSCNERYLERFVAGSEPKAHTALTQEPDFFEDSPVRIVSPVVNAVYEVGAKADEKIVFELAPKKELINVSWELDDKSLSLKDCGGFVTSCHWTPMVGKHILKASVETQNEGRVGLAPVPFEVLEYKKGW